MLFIKKLNFMLLKFKKSLKLRVEKPLFVLVENTNLGFFKKKIFISLYYKLLHSYKNF